MSTKAEQLVNDVIFEARTINIGPYAADHHKAARALLAYISQLEADREKLSEVLERIDIAVHALRSADGIPFYAYGDNQAAVTMGDAISAALSELASIAAAAAKQGAGTK